MGGFIHSTELNDDLYAVQVDMENCRCNTCLQVAYFVLDSAKTHFMKGDTDSLTWAISDNPNRGPDQLFEEDIKDQGFFDRYKDCVFSENGKKQILHIGVEKYYYNCTDLSPKNYIINNEIVLKGAILYQNPQPLMRLNSSILIGTLSLKVFGRPLSNIDPYSPFRVLVFG
ncbi:MAG: hypothetical protein EZS28_029823 [Streblomastix strix]|uniref:Uncharacterized protein n=1 Tax=Streblomastix strix TaxID=222440 RepID=A0A5J4UXQ0_9EUKA|nr:MAG: hypothetical protein EZS28_029823 [Streblomastix strix]